MSAKAKKRVGLILLAGVALAAIWLIATERAGALPPYSKLIDYYSDATFTSLTGVCFRDCQGVLSCEPGSQQTVYWVTELDYECSGSGTCCIRCFANSTRVSCPQNVINNYPCPECSW